jgi:Starch-binding associating with outer membrane
MRFYKLKYLALAASLAVTVASCEKDFGDTNVNPNAPSTPSTKFLFGSAITGIRGNMNGAAGLLYVQHMAEYIYTNEGRYFNTQYSYNGIYAGPLMDIQRIIDLNTDPETKVSKQVTDNSPNANQLGYARVLKAFLMLHMTDRWGAIPYTESLQGVKNTKPKFDSQKFIYNDLLKELKEASDQITVAMPNDALFGGSFTKWKKWANSLRAIVALRMAKTEDAAVAQTAFNEAVAAGLMTSNADNATFTYLANSTYESPWYTNYTRNGRYDYGSSKTVIDDRMVPTNDPRLPLFSRKIGGVYKGIAYGENVQTEYGVDGALLGTTIAAQTFPLQLTTYSQMCFTMAEAALRGWIPGGDATVISWYNTGIDASMDQWFAISSPVLTITPAEKTAYETQAAIAIVPAETFNQKLEKIQTQKWLNFYMSNGYEAWAEWRRTGYPVLAPAPDAVNEDKQIPRRQQYVQTENDLNKENYDAAVSAQGPDKLSTKLWWDKQ